ncbi:hypothetical protein V5799_001270 [Amblyomma americanum]|uniref:Uncharacterized protein n=1 Tax=Amblyomma americanum TaxID=6943 RepID=A0AAQ4D0P1_AMBAM
MCQVLLAGFLPLLTMQFPRRIRRRIQHVVLSSDEPLRSAGHPCLRSVSIAGMKQHAKGHLHDENKRVVSVPQASCDTVPSGQDHPGQAGIAVESSGAERRSRAKCSEQASFRF